jgi:hypothetical protein
MKKSLFMIVIGFLFLSLCSSLAQDTISNSGKEKFSIGLNYTSPSFNRSKSFGFLSGIYELNLNVPIKKNWNIVFIIPYSIYSMDSEGESALGNLTAGFKYNSETQNPFSFKGLLSLPTISKNDRMIAAISTVDFWNFPRHLYGGLITDLEIEKRYSNGNGMYSGFGFGNYFMIPTGDNNGDVEDFLKYFVKGGFEKMNSVGFDASLKGIFLLTNDKDFEDNFLHMLNIGVSYKSEVFNPRLFFVLPIGENYSDMIQNLFGIELTFNIR